jgi:hypothetical protein
MIRKQFFNAYICHINYILLLLMCFKTTKVVLWYRRHKLSNVSHHWIVHCNDCVKYELNYKLYYVKKEEPF